MKQTKLQKDHYEIFGYQYNPVYEDAKTNDYSDIKMQAKNKELCLGAVKILLDNFDCEHIAIFNVKGSLNEKVNKND